MTLFNRHNCFLFISIIFSLQLVAQQARVNAGTLKHFEQFKSSYVSARNVDVWLPDNYQANIKYPVLYMHDGQMLFDSSINWNKQEWGIDETMQSLINLQVTRPCIVVGIWNAGMERHTDYLPKKAFESLTPYQQDTLLQVKAYGSTNLFTGKMQSDLYLRFIVHELKPFIDSSFSTLPDQPNTFMAGSSMGGLISMYAICEYPQVFGGAACLSTHWPGIFTLHNNPIPATMLQYFDTHLPDPLTHLFYFDYGTETLDTMYKSFQMQADKILKAQGYHAGNWLTKEFPGEDHSEKAWRKRFQFPAGFLLKK